MGWIGTLDFNFQGIKWIDRVKLFVTGSLMYLKFIKSLFSNAIGYAMASSGEERYNYLPEVLL